MLLVTAFLTFPKTARADDLLQSEMEEQSQKTESRSEPKFKYEYGVFLGADPKDIPQMKDYHIIVIDAQGFSKKQIKKLKSAGHVVYSYLNVGAIETFRPYYEEYKLYTLSAYEHWEEEYWIDVTQKPWQEHIVGVSEKLKKKGVDGLFVDNYDVYYHYRSDAVYKSLTKILKAFRKQGFYILINGGDIYVKEYMRRNKKLSLIDGINQESVFSKVNWEDGSFGKKGTSEKNYFLKYAAKVKKRGGDVCFLEYTKDKEFRKQIKAYCKKKGYRYYISGDLDLGTR